MSNPPVSQRLAVGRELEHERTKQRLVSVIVLLGLDLTVAAMDRASHRFFWIR